MASLEAAGRKVWSQAGFTKGDFVNFGAARWYQVVRANKTTLTVPSGANIGHLRTVVTTENARNALGGAGWTLKISYTEVRGRRRHIEPP